MFIKKYYKVKPIQDTINILDKEIFKFIDVKYDNNQEKNKNDCALENKIFMTFKKENRDTPNFYFPIISNKIKDSEESLVNYRYNECEKMNEYNLIKEDNHLNNHNNNNADMHDIIQSKESEDYNKLINNLLDQNNLLKIENEDLINNFNIYELREKYDKLNIDYTILEEQNKSNNIKYCELEKKYDTLNNDFNKINEEFNKLKEIKDTLKNSYNKLKEEYNELKNKYNSLIDDLNKKNKNMIKNDVLPCENDINSNQNTNLKYIFLSKCVYNKDSSFYINSFIQCLFHVNELINYFLYIYPNVSSEFNIKNKNVNSRGKISLTFYNLLKESFQIDAVNKNNSNHNNLCSDEFINTLYQYRPELKNFDYHNNNIIDLIISLFQAMHEELNYLGNNILQNNNEINELDRFNMLKSFNNDYNNCNFSIISKLFYGTFEQTIKCESCESIYYNYEKFETISFDVRNYKQKIFDIYNGFKNNEKPQIMNRANKVMCQVCKKLKKVEYSYKIIQPPNKL